MNIKDYLIDIKNSSLQDRLKLRQVLLDNEQIIYAETKLITAKKYRYSMFGFIRRAWSCTFETPNISLQDFIDKFKKHDQVRNLAIYKKSGQSWTKDELIKICEYVNDDTDGLNDHSAVADKYIFDQDNIESFMGWRNNNTHAEHKNFKNCLQVAYEDLFPEEQQTSSEPEIKYPYYLHRDDNTTLIKIEKDRYTYLTIPKYPTCLGKEYKTRYIISNEQPCDFTIEPEIFDIDWWDARFDAGLDVYVRLNDDGIDLCKLLKPSSWVNVKQFYTSNPNTNYCNEVHVGTPTTNSYLYEQSKETQKEKTMTIQELLTKLFGAAMPTDYEQRPAILVVAYNRDGSERGTATADSLEQVTEKVKATPDLWGCKILTYKLSKEVFVDVPVSVVKATTENGKQ